ncbi:TetR/AcrR family transcriptional regulator [Streptomyces ficellus]|uniref:TetR/AcrR family transcriptional regulator n=1 Tax=Streptomyces ficellus TaxID=1977088 RepID=A0A6I6FK91_9ACTN|nr:TetR/AcrR family transcriptional regulator [Streptomyces ficellus]QGV80602.1 TetR/AcrR family transcriptional regulator [Streptomyces ficellus]
MGQPQGAGPGGRHERADAADNRCRILEAAARIIADRGAGALTMNGVAQETGIGVGTVYRRFGDVAQLLFALLDEREKRFQDAFMTGPPPLGPDAPPLERLRAFLHALADRVTDQLDMLLAAEAAAPAARHRSGAYATMHAHVTVLVTRARPGADASLLAHLLLAPFAPSLVHHLTREGGRSVADLKAGADELLRGLAPDAR